MHGCKSNEKQNNQKQKTITTTTRKKKEKTKRKKQKAKKGGAQCIKQLPVLAEKFRRCVRSGPVAPLDRMLPNFVSRKKK